MAEAHDPASGLFSRQLRAGRWVAATGTEPATSTAICLIAISRAGIPPSALGVDPGRSIAATAAILRRRYSGGLGLALWANAVHGSFGFAALGGLCGLDPERASALPARLTTMELAWLLAGLLHAQRREDGPAIADLVAAALAELEARQQPSGLFAHSGTAGPLLHRVRRRVANFADQIYPVQALALAGGPAAIASAGRCAAALAGLAGPLGQWWWQYDPADGRVLRRYPVYAVHQHGMAPMALMALAAAGGADHRADHRETAWRGLAWLSGNELGAPMVDDGAGTIWRDIRPVQGRAARLAADLRLLAGIATPPPAALRRNRETRPYEWAWCLMAGAQLATPPHRPHLA
jgi:hypothetical protein